MKNPLLVLFILLPTIILAQNRFSISGFIQSQDGTPLAFANVLLDRNNKYAVSDENGRYRIGNVRRGEYVITISSLGYETITRNITVNADLNLDFTMIENVEALDDVIVEGKKTSTRQEERAITIGSFELAEVVSQTNILADAVDKISGVRIRRSGSFGDQSDISINGLNGSAIRTFIDGIPLEFIYPRADIATLPLTGIKRVDVYKGVIPVDISTDALGGGINIITEDNNVNRFYASHSSGSFNTHLSDISLTLVDGKDNYLKIDGGLNYSDNDYTFEASLQVRDPFTENGLIAIPGTSNIKRFHDLYRLQYTQAKLGTSNKNWADKAEISINFFDRFREYQNNLRITNVAIGEAFEESENFSVIAKYDKTLIKDKLKLRTISNYSDELVKFVDTTANVYNWLGDIIIDGAGREDLRGEFDPGNPVFSETTTKNYVNRTTLNLKLPKESNLMFSNIIAHQTRELKDFDIDNPTEFSIAPDQKITKNITGLQYDNNSLIKERVEFSTALKYYTYKLEGFSSLNRVPIEDTEGFFGWNAGLKVQVVDEFSIRGSYERGFLIPEVTQFAGNGANIAPNGELQPEESDNYNLGFRFYKRFNSDYALTLTTNGFLRKQRDFIFLDANATRQRNENIGDIDAEGVEGELKFNFLKNFNWNTNVSFVNKTIEEFRLATSTDELIGSRLPNTPRFFYNTELSWQTKDIFNTGIGLRLYSLFTHVDEFNIRPVATGESIDTTPDAFVPEQDRLDFGISLSLMDKKITAAFNIVNITDEELFDNFSVPRPGRNFNFKLIYEISNF
ncbi:MAG: TonB-dependent receptor [Bacteroidota bacterium]